MIDVNRLQEDIYNLGRKSFWRHYLVTQDQALDEPTADALLLLREVTEPLVTEVQTEAYNWYITGWQGAYDDSATIERGPTFDDRYDLILAEYKSAIK